MLPASLLRYSIAGDRVVPRFLGDADHPWLRALIDEALRFVGRRRRELDERLRQPLACGPDAWKQRLAAHVLDGTFAGERRTRSNARAIRAALFGAAARSTEPRELVVARVAAGLGMTATDLADALFADLPSERIVVAPKLLISPQELALRANLALAQALIFRASSIVIDVEGNARALVRHAKLRGLICEVEAPEDAGAIRLRISGPLALFRRTLLYGRALGELLPLLSWSRRFRLRATCMLDGAPRTLELASGEPIFPSTEPRRFDSSVEARFARDFARLALDWDIIREPEPVRAGSTLVFPDFALVHRTEPERRWLLEIIGFWMPDYLARKLAQYRSAGLRDLILCIDEQRDCAPGDLPPDAYVLRYRRRVDAAAVQALISRRAGTS